MKEGTKSVLFASHSIIHSLYVLKAWRILHKEWPERWQIICILFHDIGHLGKNYLSSFEEKEQHWILGARICKFLFSQKGFDFVASHTKNPSVPIDPKFKAADRYSWIIANDIWLNWNKWVEKPLTEPKKWKKICLQNMDNLNKTSHEIWLEERQKRK